MAIIDDYSAINKGMKQIIAVQVFVVQDCLSGKCDCPKAEDCKFRRCDNCDNPVMANGKAFPDADYGHYNRRNSFECPECGATAGD